MAELPVTIQQVMEAMPTMFRPDKAIGVNARILFELSGDDGGTWTVSIAEGKCTVQQAAVESPSATIKASAGDYLAIARGELDPMKAFMTGKLKAQGDMGVIMRFMQFFGMS